MGSVMFIVARLGPAPLKATIDHWEDAEGAAERRGVG